MSDTIQVIETGRDTLNRMTEKETGRFTADTLEQENNLLNIYRDSKFQEWIGFGGAFTEAVSATLAKLSKPKQAEIFDAYFDKEKGIGYNFCRTHIGSCDYSVSEYTYDDVCGDFGLCSFTIDRDRETVIPMLLRACKMAPDIKIFASPWSPPAWMKTNHDRTHGGSLKKECRQVWAEYIVRYIKEYEREGISIWGITVQNEAKAVQNWESCVYSAEEERDFVQYYLEPELKRQGLKEVKIICWDHNKERLFDRVRISYGGGAENCFYGAGVHWYSGDHFEALELTHQMFPEKKMIASEACCRRNEENPWKNGERYAHDIIGDLNHHVSAWTDWNLLLDETTGPSHWREEQIALGDKGVWWYGESPVMVNLKDEKLQYNPAYYYIGHFSKYIRRGARRIGHSIYTTDLEATAFENPDGEVVVIVLNRNDEDYSFTLRCDGKITNLSIKAHSIQTLLF